MLVTAIEKYTKGKYKVYLEEQFAFVLYKSELHSFRIEENKELEEEDYNTILNEIILKRAKHRALHLLEKMDRTEQELKNKLKEGYYPEAIIDQAVEYVKSYHYIDDENYTERFIVSKSKYNSRLEIVSKLRQKGITKEVIHDFYENSSIDEREAIAKLIKKKISNMDEIDQEQQRKLYMYLCRKGFQYEDIVSVMEQIKNNV